MYYSQAAFVSVGSLTLKNGKARNNFCNYRPRTIASQRSKRSEVRRVTNCKGQFGAESQGKEAIDANDGEKLLHIVFVHPQIHWNTGNIGRTCLGLGAALHLVGPMGFSLDERQIRRAGLDYWQHVDLHVYEDWLQFANGKMKDLGGTRLFFTKFGDQCATEIQWPSEGKIVMIFGSEVNGFDDIRDWLDSEGSNEKRVAFPMVDERFRSFNLSTTASMALWDAYKDVTTRVNINTGPRPVDSSVVLSKVR
ncbi:rRNA methyltransferase [Gracilaria domingensis]|nr:rRNA methyltransferase [Gracilaria domingensis]